jgi:hypothetical protein
VVRAARFEEEEDGSGGEAASKRKGRGLGRLQNPKGEKVGGRLGLGEG